jgi:cellulose synthase/poly-beta-1,6-N-acetylglucosamine synthase-like glycosyltransferase
MWASEATWLFGVMLALAAITPPALHYIKAKNSAARLQFPEDSSNPPELTVVLPVRNESIVIREKIDEILSMDYRMSRVSILVVDSASTDHTGPIAREHLEKNAGEVSWKIENVERPGKSIAVNMALDVIETEFFVMMDAEAILLPSSLRLLARWFQDSKIGGVCGQLDLPHGSPGHPYRSRFNLLRVGESVIDSTPIIEGSICAFRMSAIGHSRIDSGNNADDSQLAMLVRRNGFRAIMDPEIKFFEPDSESSVEKRSRRVRRAQGLSRAFWANRDLRSKRYGAYAPVFSSQLYFHLIFPWLISVSLVSISLPLFFGLMEFPEIGWHAALFPGAILAMGSASRTCRGILDGSLILVHSHFLLLIGRRLHIWEPDEELRLAIQRNRHESG